MKTKDLEGKVEVQMGSWYGHYKVSIVYRGRLYCCNTTNSSAVDRVTTHDLELASDKTVENHYTYKQALTALWNECKRKNALGEYSY